MPAAERDAYENLILLCLDHHKVIDDDPDYWTVEVLKRIKSVHETWIEQVTEAGTKVRDHQELIYARIIDRWASDCGLEGWPSWTSGLVAPTPSVRPGTLESLDLLRRWLFTRPWPRLYTDLEAAFDNFGAVANDLVGAIRLAFDERHTSILMLEKFYKARWFSQDVYDDLAEQYEWVVDVIHDLTFELTRAANRVLDLVHLRIDPLFRFDEGILMVERQGAGGFFEWHSPAYAGDQLRSERPYAGIDQFILDRVDRDIHFGEGANKNGLRRITAIRLTD